MCDAICREATLPRSLMSASLMWVQPTSLTVSSSEKLGVSLLLRGLDVHLQDSRSMIHYWAMIVNVISLRGIFLDSHLLVIKEITFLSLLSNYCYLMISEYTSCFHFHSWAFIEKILSIGTSQPIVQFCISLPIFKQNCLFVEDTDRINIFSCSSSYKAKWAHLFIRSRLLSWLCPVLSQCLW